MNNLQYEIRLHFIIYSHPFYMQILVLRIYFQVIWAYVPLSNWGFIPSLIPRGTTDNDVLWSTSNFKLFYTVIETNSSDLQNSSSHIKDSTHTREPRVWNHKQILPFKAGDSYVLANKSKLFNTRVEVLFLFLLRHELRKDKRSEWKIKLFL